MSVSEVFGLLSGIFWTIAYVCVIWQSFRDRTYAMPFAAMVMNIIWEFLFTFVYRSVGGLMQEIINLVWFALDIVIVYTYLRFWRADYPKNMRESWFWPMFVLAFLLVAPMLVATVSVFGRDDGSVYTAFGDNLIMSLLFLTMLMRRQSRRGQSMWIAWTKLLGTATASISQYLYDPHNALWIAMYIEIFALDLLYAVLLARAPKYAPDAKI